MKYKVGDKVKVRKEFHKGWYSGVYCNEDMASYRGKIVTIKDIFAENYCIEEMENKSSSMYVWSDTMFDGLASEVESEKNIKEKNMKNFRIKDYKVHEDRAVIVEFKDGTKEKAVCNEDDKFDIERGITICVLKHIFGSDGYKSMVKKAMNQIKAVDKAKEDKKKEEELIARKKAKADRRKARRLERKRKERIAEMKEAYLAAMKEHDMETRIEVALDSILGDDFDDLK